MLFGTHFGISIVWRTSTVRLLTVALPTLLANSRDCSRGFCINVRRASLCARVKLGQLVLLCGRSAKRFAAITCMIFTLVRVMFRPILLKLLTYFDHNLCRNHPFYRCYFGLLNARSILHCSAPLSDSAILQFAARVCSMTSFQRHVRHFAP